jgi:ABC-type Mn2+/Zn2+ transport system permease subunit
MAWLTDPWSEAIVQRAFLEVVLLGIAGGALGCWIVLYSLSYSAESLAHGLFPGLVTAALIGAPLLLGGAVGIAVAAGAVAVVGRLPGLDRDVGVAVVVTTLFGLGVLLALSPASPPGVQSLLFGDILGLTSGDLIASGVLAVVVPGALWLLHGRLLAVGFDRTSARALGVRTAWIDGVVLLLIAAAIMVAVQALGNLLVVALLVAPAAAARLVARRMLPMMGIAAALAIACGIGGLYASYYLRTAAGASIAATLVIVYLLVAIAVQSGRRSAPETT